MIVRTSANVEVDEAGDGDQVRDALHALAEDVVRHAERLEDRRRLLDDLQQPVVLDHDQRVDRSRRFWMPVSAWSARRLPSNANGFVTTPTVSASSSRPSSATTGAAPAGPTALAGRDEDHVGALERLLQLVAALLGRREPDVGVRASAEPARRLRADVDLHVGIRVEQRLRVRVHRDELDTGEARLDHAVDRVRAAAADTHDLDHCEVVAVLRAHLDLPEGQALIEPTGMPGCPHSKRGYGLLVGIVNGTPQASVEAESSTST